MDIEVRAARYVDKCNGTRTTKTRSTLVGFVEETLMLPVLIMAAAAHFGGRGGDSVNMRGSAESAEAAEAAQPEAKPLCMHF